MVTLASYVERVDARAREVNWRSVLLVALMALPFLIGAVCRYVVRAVGWVLAWLYAAAVEGWRAAGPRRDD